MISQNNATKAHMLAIEQESIRDRHKQASLQLQSTGPIFGITTRNDHTRSYIVFFLDAETLPLFTAFFDAYAATHETRFAEAMRNLGVDPTPAP